MDRKGNPSGGLGPGPAEGRKARGAGAGGKGKLKAAVEGTMAVRRFKKGPRGRSTKPKEPEGPEELQRALHETREYAQRMKVNEWLKRSSQDANGSGDGAEP